MKYVKQIPAPYRQAAAVAAGEYVFLGLHRGEGKTLKEQIDSALEHMGTTLEKHALNRQDLCRVNVWLRDMRDRREMEESFARHFSQPWYPSRTAFAAEIHESGCLVMIDGVALSGR